MDVIFYGHEIVCKDRKIEKSFPVKKISKFYR